MGIRRVAPVGAPAGTAIGATLAFIALTCWWLTQDRAMPYGDAAEHLLTAFTFHDDLARGDWLGPLTYTSVYAPLTPFVGGLAVGLGGRTVAAPVLAENLVFVPLLALGCYGVARLAYGAWAGALAVVFALGAPLIAEQFHVLMLDAPQAALVAVTVWLVLASDRFRRVDLAALAGLAAGCGLVEKQSFPLYVAGFVAIVLLRGRGWRNRRGLAAFLLVACVVAGPWYAVHASDLGTFTGAAGSDPTVPPLARPPPLSSANLGWYFWALANGLLFVPLLAFATVGVATESVAVVRRRGGAARFMPELLGGGALAWLAITAVPHHDVRYTMGLVVFLAVLGTGWIVRLPRAWRAAAVAALGLAVVATTLGATFGVGHRSSALLPGNRYAPHGEGVPPLRRFTLYANRDFLVSGPRQAGDVLGLMQALRAAGVRQVLWSDAQAPLWDADYNANGLLAFARIAQLSVPSGVIDASSLAPTQAILIRARTLGRAPPCARLHDDEGIWIHVGAGRDFCPRRR